MSEFWNVGNNEKINMIFKVSHNSNRSLDNHSECTFEMCAISKIKRFKTIIQSLSLVNYSEYNLRGAQLMNKTKERREYFKFFIAITSSSLFECRCWSACLDTASWHAHQGAAKWWFHIYQLVQAYLYPQDDQEQVRPSIPCTTRREERNHKAKRKVFQVKSYENSYFRHNFLLQFRICLLFSH